MDYGLLANEGLERFKQAVSRQSRKPQCAVMIGGYDLTDNVKAYSFSRQTSNILHENTPSSGSVTIADIDGEYIQNGHSIIPKGANVKIFAGFGDDMIPRFSGIVSNPRVDTKGKEIIFEIADGAQSLDDMRIEGFYSDYGTPKALIDNLISQSKPAIIPIEYENDSGEIATFEFGLSLGASFNSLCSTGSGTTMTDITQDFERVELGMAVKNVTDGSVGHITSITSTAPATTPNDTIVCSGGLHGGTANVWANGNEYQVYDKLYIDSRSGWSIIDGACYCVFQTPYFDENGVLQVKRKSVFTDVDVAFYDRDIIDIDYANDAQVINAKAIKFRKPIIYYDKIGSTDDTEIGQKHRREIIHGIPQEYAELTDEPLITTYSAAGKVIMQELGYYSYPRYILIMTVPARPELQYFDRVMVSSEKRNIHGRYTIIGIDEEMGQAGFINRFTLLGSQERV